MSYDPNKYTPPNAGAIDGNFCSTSQSFPAVGGNVNFNLREPIDFDFTGLYTPPAGNQVNFYFGEVPLNKVDPECVFQKQYSDTVFVTGRITPSNSLQKQYSNEVEIVLEPVVVVWPSFQKNYLQEVVTDTRPEGWLPYKTSSNDIRCPWNLPEHQDQHIRCPWVSINNEDKHVNCLFSKEGTKDATICVPWGDVSWLDPRPLRIPWESGDKIDSIIRCLWNNFIWQDTGLYRIPWGVFDALDRSLVLPYSFPPRLYKAMRVPWDIPRIIDLIFRLLWVLPDTKDKLHNTLWGRMAYERICTRDYLPDVSPNIDINIKVPLGSVGDGDHVDFWFDKFTYDERCTQREPSGWRDKWPPPDVPGTLYTPVKDAYIVNNSCTVVRLPERTVLDVRSVSITGNIDSWCWQFSAVVQTQASLNLVTPTLSSMHTIEVDINGNKWEFYVERWSKSEVFGNITWTIAGSSKSVELATPYDSVHSRIETSAKNAEQVVIAELTGTGWTQQWDTVDWLVPANVYNYNDQTTLAAVKLVADAIGSKIQSHQVDKTLIFIPRYPVSPWDWAATAPDVILPDAAFTEISRVYDSSPAVNGVYTSGETQGVIVLVKRQGTPGDILAPMSTNRLITHVDAGKERGRTILADAGEWVKTTVMTICRSIPVEGPPLILPGKLIQVTSTGGDWKGQSVSTQVQAAWGSQGLVVTQSVGIEKFNAN